MWSIQYSLLVLVSQVRYWRNATYCTRSQSPLKQQRPTQFPNRTENPPSQVRIYQIDVKILVARVTHTVPAALYRTLTRHPTLFSPPFSAFSLVLSRLVLRCIIALSVSFGIVHTARPEPVRAQCTHVHPHAPSLALGGWAVPPFVLRVRPPSKHIARATPA